MIKVAKFGGSSLADTESIKQAGQIVLSDNSRKFIVVSAPGICRGRREKITDLLYKCYDGDDVTLLGCVKQQFLEIAEGLGCSIPNLDFFEAPNKALGLDYYLSRGEYFCGLLFAQYINYRFIDAAEVIFFKEDGSLDSEKSISTLRKRLEGCDGAVIPGFYGMGQGGTVKTFSRGGSDVTGALVAVAAKADMYENWTDVDGFMAADPRVVRDCVTLPCMSYGQLAPLCRAGALVMHPQAVAPVCKWAIPVNIKNTFAPNNQGTLISYSSVGGGGFGGVSGLGGYATLVIKDEGCPSSFLLSPLISKKIEAEIIQRSGDTCYLTVKEGDICGKEREILSLFCRDDGWAYIKKKEAILLVAHSSFKYSLSGADRLLGALDGEKIGVRCCQINPLGGNMTLVIDEEMLAKAIKTVYNVFNQ